MSKKTKLKLVLGIIMILVPVALFCYFIISIAGLATFLIVLAAILSIFCLLWGIVIILDIIDATIRHM